MHLLTLKVVLRTLYYHDSENKSSLLEVGGASRWTSGGIQQDPTRFGIFLLDDIQSIWIPSGAPQLGSQHEEPISLDMLGIALVNEVFTSAMNIPLAAGPLPEPNVTLSL